MHDSKHAGKNDTVGKENTKNLSEPPKKLFQVKVVHISCPPTKVQRQKVVSSCAKCCMTVHYC